MVSRRLKHYEIRQKIGVGGMATVYQARDTRSGAIVAVKVMHPHLAENQQYIERFRREAQTAMALDSPHVVRVLEFDHEGGVHFLVMEYVAGVTVQQLIQERGGLPIHQAVDIAAQVASGLTAAHQYGIVHRDIKPQNVMITPDGTVKLMDFGIARSSAMGTMTQTGVFMGSPHYVSPEQAEGKRVDIRSDIYSLGIVLYQMLAGIVPFSADTPWAIMRQHLEREPVPIHRLRVDVPPEVEAVANRALAKDPAKRYQSPAEIYAALRAIQSPSTDVRQELATIVDMRPQLTPLPVTPTSGRPPVSKRRTWTAIAAGALVVVAAGVWILSMSGQKPLLMPTASPLPIMVTRTGGTSEQSSGALLTPINMSTSTATPQLTLASSPTPQSTASPTPTHTSATRTRTATATGTATPTAMRTATATSAKSPTSTATSKPSPTLTPTRLFTSTPTPVPPTDTPVPPTDTPLPPTKPPKPPTDTPRPPTDTPKPPTDTPKAPTPTQEPTKPPLPTDTPEPGPTKPPLPTDTPGAVQIAVGM